MIDGRKDGHLYGRSDGHTDIRTDNVHIIIKKYFDKKIFFLQYPA